VADAEAWIGDGSDRHIPVERIRWDLATAAAWQGFVGGPADGYRWMLLPAVRQPGQPPLQVQIELAGMASERGELTQQMVHRYTYSASAAVLVLQPAALTPEELV
ncbi:MAG: hypothetical protein ACKPHU_17165, partial [Planctomycetaceae bacterium]